MNTGRMLVERVAIGIVASIAVLIALSLVTPILSPASLLLATGVGFLGFGFSETASGLIRKNLEWMPRGREPLGTRQTGLVTQRGRGEQQVGESWLITEEQKHHRHLVDWFFTRLKSLRVAHSSREPFHLDLFTLTPPPRGLPIDASLFSLPLREEATSHLGAPEYSAARRAFDNLLGSVAAFNARVDKVISAINLEEKIRRVLPDMRNESEPGSLTRENYYYSRNLWLALEKAVANVDAESQILPSGTDLAKMMPWGAGYKLVIGGYTVARVKEARHAEELQRLISDSSREPREVIAERETVLSRLEVLIGTFREELRKLLEDFQVRQRLYGRCHVEDALEERVGVGRSTS